ncbi:MAG: hypothetical protein IKC47_01170, partial [Clostridia bacterium]|nr:hypothetical protein [Clostridia bacterium]
QVFRWGTNPYQISFEKGIKYPVQKGYGNSTEAYLSIEEHSVLDIVTQLWSTKESYGTRYYFDGKKLCFMDVDKCYDVVDVKVLDSQVEAKIRYQELSSKFNYTLELILTEEAYENGLTNVYITFSGYKYLFTGFAGDENSDWYYYVDERFGLNIENMEMFLEFEHKLPLRYEHDIAERKINVRFMCECGTTAFPLVWFDPEIGK